MKPAHMCWKETLEQFQQRSLRNLASRVKTVRPERRDFFDGESRRRAARFRFFRSSSSKSAWKHVESVQALTAIAPILISCALHLRLHSRRHHANGCNKFSRVDRKNPEALQNNKRAWFTDTSKTSTACDDDRKMSRWSAAGKN